MRILSLGAGVQSTTVLLMSCLDYLPRIDHAIFADTGWEPPAVYKHLEWLEQYVETVGIPVHRVFKGNIRDDQRHAVIRGKKAAGQRYASMPLYVKVNGQAREGMIRRQCTREYKIEPIQKKLRELVGLKPRQRKIDIQVDQWFGISADEAGRMRESKYSWISFCYPLIDFSPPMTRRDCLKWMAAHGFPEPPRSACIGCPFHNDHEWRQMRDRDPESWADAISFDRLIRHRDMMEGEAYLHRSLVPLDQVDLRTAEDRGQENLWINECEGMCGV